MAETEINREKICKYINCHVPIDICNLKCSYCYIRQAPDFKEKTSINYSPDFIRKALSKKRLKGTALIVLCGGGETMLCRQLPDIVEALVSEGHYIHIVTNGTVTNAFDELFSRKMDFEYVLFKLSFHYLELKRLGLLDEFVESFNRIRSMGASVTVELIADDELIPYIDELKEYSIKNFKALPHIAPARQDKTLKVLTKYPHNEYCKIWGQFHSKLFDYKMNQVIDIKRKEYCKAGEWALQMDLGSGDVYQCIKHPYLDNLYKDINQEIKLEAVGINCLLSYCQNGHIYLPLGVLPEVKAPAYLEMRNRKMTGNDEWVTGKMKEVLSQRFFDDDLL